MATNIYPTNVAAPDQHTALSAMNAILNVAFHRGIATYDSDAEAAVIADLQTTGVTLAGRALSDNDVAGWLIALAPGIIRYLEDLRDEASIAAFSGTPITMTSEPNTNA